LPDVLRELCEDRGIRLIYTNNKTTVLSATTPQDIPHLRAHRLFRECPRAVAEAILGYYVGGDTGEQALAEITRHVAGHRAKSEWRVEPPDPHFRVLLARPDRTSRSGAQPVPRAGSVMRHPFSTAAHGPISVPPASGPSRRLMLCFLHSVALTFVLLIGPLAPTVGITVTLYDGWVQGILAGPVQLMSLWHLYVWCQERTISSRVASFVGLLSGTLYLYSVAVMLGFVAGPSFFHTCSVLATAILMTRVALALLRREIRRMAAALANQGQVQGVEAERAAPPPRRPDTDAAAPSVDEGLATPFPSLNLDSTSCYEMEVRAMNQRSFLGGDSAPVDPGRGVRPTTDDVLELEIVVSEPIQSV